MGEIQSGSCTWSFRKNRKTKPYQETLDLIRSGETFDTCHASLPCWRMKKVVRREMYFDVCLSEAGAWEKAPIELPFVFYKLPSSFGKSIVYTLWYSFWRPQSPLFSTCPFPSPSRKIKRSIETKPRIVYIACLIRLADPAAAAKYRSIGGGGGRQWIARSIALSFYCSFIQHTKI